MRRIKKIIAFILLLAHCNTSMFFPVVEEKDIYVNGRQQEDINSVVELIIKKLCSPDDAHSTDEDDDQPNYFQIVKTGSYVPSTVAEPPITPSPIETENPAGFLHTEPVFALRDVLTPPPDGSSD